MLFPPANAGAIDPSGAPGSGTTAYLPFTEPASTAAWLKSQPIAMAALPEAKAVTVALPPIAAHLAAGQLLSPKSEVYASMPLRARSLLMAALYVPPLSSASSPPFARMNGIAPYVYTPPTARPYSSGFFLWIFFAVEISWVQIQ